MTEPRPTDPHAEALKAELGWLAETVTARLTHFFEGTATPFVLPDPPALPGDSALARLIDSAGLDAPARLVLALALAPHLAPAALDPFFVKNSAIDRVFSEFGAARGEAQAGGPGFAPSAVTALFLLGGTDAAARISAMALFAPDHPLRAAAGLTVGAVADPGGATLLSGPLTLPPHRVLTLCAGRPPRPDYAPGFPAKRLTTRLDWDELILPQGVKHSIEHLVAWYAHRHLIREQWGLARRVGAGFKALFYGPPGTGKTLTAAMLGKRTGLDVYRIDLSMVVSKYIGETEKNLAQVFDMAEMNDWILFFDEADALFGARGQSGSANDRYANQEVAYLLQRIEDCPGLVILATNLRNTIDDAFFRRFQTVVGFPRPDAGLRRALWASILDRVPLAPDVDLEALARGHEMAGGAITNVVHHATISALRRGADTVSAHDLAQAISTEMRKEGRTA
ncbi:ATPase [Rhodovulum sulfidophilum]|uniref:ATP-binding protein n=1 Tax=Rhodovulum visakhapatnamense TaxID=364297 RepID=A0ABS1RL52_9RHOB|nr:ATP-binding protein [Rhodovulum visakhapatnamense]MBL3570067.1 ATP-binding protein [Rhodovulum visakhapatnamense]MBL3580378.1 ATP-binding protein [Rhodovulum visakhapatnamense]OLS45148.1 ATPase [Rhodovulum sulfidophilum]